MDFYNCRWWFEQLYYLRTDYLIQFGTSQPGGKGVMSGSCCANGFRDHQTVGGMVFAAVHGKHTMALYLHEAGVPPPPPGE